MSEEVKTEGTFKIKKKPGRPKKLNKNDEVVKLDLTKKEEQAEETTIEETVEQAEETVEQVEETPAVETKEEVVEDSPIVELNKQEEETKEIKPLVDQPKIPDNLEKLVDFMRETGGTIEDYVRLNADYSNVSEDILLREYYSKTKPHLDKEEIDFLLEDQFSWDEDVEEERAVRKKKLAYKEEIAKAKNFLEKMKDDYYDEIKLKSYGNDPEVKKAMDFFNRYNEEQQVANKRHETFSNNTKNFFNNDFKGFDFNVGEKRFRYNINNKESVANSQSNLNNFVEKFFDKNGELKNYNEYHKAIYAADNVDTIASHFYEQGKADAVKDMMAKSKNIDNAPRTTSTGDVYVGGLKVKSVSGVDSSKLKLRINKK
tara:strand:- start:4266 stop:5381 length:1116 start_codon:yes stop_codon:yes gene_type:complete